MGSSTWSWSQPAAVTSTPPPATLYSPMRYRRWGFSMKLVTTFFALALGSASAQTTPPPPGPSAMPAGAGKAIVQEKCVVCHALTVVTSKHSSHKEWDQVVNQMVSRGADLTDEEIDTVIEYLSKNYGPLDQTGTPAATG